MGKGKKSKPPRRLASPSKRKRLKASRDDGRSGLSKSKLTGPEKRAAVGPESEYVLIDADEAIKIKPGKTGYLNVGEYPADTDGCDLYILVAPVRRRRPR